MGVMDGQGNLFDEAAAPPPVDVVCRGGWPVPADNPVRLCGCERCACCGRGLGNEDVCASGIADRWGCAAAGWVSADPDGRWAERDGQQVAVVTVFDGVVETEAGFAWTHDRFCPPCKLRAYAAADARREGRVPYAVFPNATWGDTFLADGTGRWPEILDNPNITMKEVNERRAALGAGGGAGDADVGRRGDG